MKGIILKNSFQVEVQLPYTVQIAVLPWEIDIFGMYTVLTNTLATWPMFILKKTNKDFKTIRAFYWIVPNGDISIRVAIDH